MIIKPLLKPFDKSYENIASDKSISHRFAMLSMLSDKPSYAKNYLLANDTLDSLKIIEKLGQEVVINGSDITINPKPIKNPKDELYCGNSGTSMRIFMGLLSGVNGGEFVLNGDEYLNARPMKRVIAPLSKCGAKIDATIKDSEFYAPLKIYGKKLDFFEYEDKLGSAQVKSALILASLQGSGAIIKEGKKSRNHTENMLKSMGADISINENIIEVKPMQKPLNPLDIHIPNDPSSAFFFAVAAAIVKGSKVKFSNMLLNPTRIKAYEVLKLMGAKVEIIQKSISGGEMIGDIIVEHDKLNAVIVEEDIASLIDELPALSIAFAFAKGKSIVKNAKELRVKETDRIKAVVENLKALGVECDELEDGFMINGISDIKELKKAKIRCFGDHRIAMSFAIFGLVSECEIDEPECVKTSFANFFEILEDLR